MYLKITYFTLCLGQKRLIHHKFSYRIKFNKIYKLRTIDISCRNFSLFFYIITKSIKRSKRSAIGFTAPWGSFALALINHRKWVTSEKWYWSIGRFRVINTIVSFCSISRGYHVCLYCFLIYLFDCHREHQKVKLNWASLMPVGVLFN